MAEKKFPSDFGDLAASGLARQTKVLIANGTQVISTELGALNDWLKIQNSTDALATKTNELYSNLSGIKLDYSTFNSSTTIPAGATIEIPVLYKKTFTNAPVTSIQLIANAPDGFFVSIKASSNTKTGFTAVIKNNTTAAYMCYCSYIAVGV